jgi:hypothetical protein
MKVREREAKKDSEMDRERVQRGTEESELNMHMTTSLLVVSHILCSSHILFDGSILTLKSDSDYAQFVVILFFQYAACQRPWGQAPLFRDNQK